MWLMLIQSSFVHPDLLHSLLEDRIPPGLADNQIGPLHNHNAGEECCVASELHNLSLFICLRKHNNVLVKYESKSIA